MILSTVVHVQMSVIWTMRQPHVPVQNVLTIVSPDIQQTARFAVRMLRMLQLRSRIIIHAILPVNPTFIKLPMVKAVRRTPLQTVVQAIQIVREPRMDQPNARQKVFAVCIVITIVTRICAQVQVHVWT